VYVGFGAGHPVADDSVVRCDSAGLAGQWGAGATEGVIALGESLAAHVVHARQRGERLAAVERGLDQRHLGFVEAGSSAGDQAESAVDVVGGDVVPARLAGVVGGDRGVEQVQGRVAVRTDEFIVVGETPEPVDESEVCGDAGCAFDDVGAWVSKTIVSGTYKTCLQSLLHVLRCDVRYDNCITVLQSEARMATVTLRLDDETRDELERLAQGRGTTVSALLRAAIDELLGRDVEVPRAYTPKSLSVIERQTLVLQHEILKRLSADKTDLDYHDKRIRVLSQGFTTEYYKEFAEISAELAPAEGALTMEILNMFTVLEAALDRLGEDALAELGDNARLLLSFEGFDYNDPRETLLADIAKYLIDDGQCPSLAYHFDDEHEGGNSHMPVLDRYLRMLPVYRAVLADRRANSGRGIFDAYNFEIKDLQKVLAGTWPRGTRSVNREPGSTDTKMTHEH
jgi:uncharacterized protein YfbU (UPF0304 family)